MIQEPKTYEAAYEELLEITQAIEEESVSVDTLTSQVKRAAELIAWCQQKLKNTEEEVGNVLAGMGKF